MSDSATRTYFTPRALCQGTAARDLIVRGEAWPLCNGGGFAALEITQVSETSITSEVRAIATLGSAHQTEIGAFLNPRPKFAGLDVSRPIIMGILNVTPDSFSDGGQFYTPDAAVARGVALLEAGASIIDVGGESTRPGAVVVDPDEECRRVLPVVKALAARGAKVSIDTRHSKTMAEAIAAGAVIVNDVSALSDPDSLDVIAHSSASLIIMHMQGEPGTMQKDPSYVWAPGDVYDTLKAKLNTCLKFNVPAERISIDPGIGFGKNDHHNAAIFDHLTMFHGLGCVLTMGASRKSFISRMSNGEGPEARLPGSLASALFAADLGAQIVRVHDVSETRQALAIWGQISGRSST